MFLHFNDKNWESFLNNWLSILTHFAKYYNLDSILNLFSILFSIYSRLYFWFILNFILNLDYF